MTHYNIEYQGPDRQANDDKAIADIQDYLTTKQWSCLMALVGQATPAQLAESGMENRPASIPTISFALELSGVRGYPFHAFCRRYALETYRAWMAGGDDPVQTDEQGFPLATHELVVQ